MPLILMQVETAMALQPLQRVWISGARDAAWCSCDASIQVHVERTAEIEAGMKIG